MFIGAMLFSLISEAVSNSKNTND